MKLSTNVTQKQDQKQTLAIRQRYALQILSMNDTALMKEAERMVEENPLLEVDDRWLSETSIDVYERASHIVCAEPTLQDVLFSQLHTCLHPISYELAGFLIESLDEDGYLRMDDLEISESTGAQTDEIEDTLAILQTFEPAGVFARNLQECLLIQLCFADIPYSQTAIMIVNYHMDDLAQHRYTAIAEYLTCTLIEVQQAIKLIRSLQPRPGAMYATSSDCIRPDARITIEDEEFHIELLRNADCFTINHRYASLKENRSCENDIAAVYVSKMMNQAQQFLDALHQRNHTLAVILSRICTHQSAFFLHHQPCQPLTMKTIAEEVHLHESTVSRALSQKYIEFEQQIVPLKLFFPSQINGTNPLVIHEKIKTLIAKENKQAPYSDAQIAEFLKQDGMELSRRTVAKYREQCHIPSAAKRKER